MKNILWLDLEQTVIVSWYELELINIQKIKEFIKSRNFDQFHIWSYAIQTDEDIDYFNTNIKGMLELALEVNISFAPSIDQIIHKLFQKEVFLYENRIEFMSFHDKGTSFHKFVKLIKPFNKDHNHTLIDDCVDNTKIFLNKQNVTLEMLNPWEDI